jgi:hypothetical protein
MSNTRGVPLYNMIFATDHDAGERIMQHIYGLAAEAQPRMQAEAVARFEREREEKTGVMGLFDPIVKVKPADLYVHRPPTPPYRLPPDD